jgi:hypothetical protein
MGGIPEGQLGMNHPALVAGEAGHQVVEGLVISSGKAFLA